ncbi:MAG: tRNA pseudouridine(38-40) synthase TruA [Sulfurimonas sp.]|nr:tRNA pseudouridine(38-40) synthase TruA [Sulfurimonas sp.]MBU3939704.1 tRNA pseudouridine(38-40) synthase TruA [bacterium]MBU4024572.1 tRNA pseudouridine(38-40) synthase TruA [bacterium]MBU4059041.1 tRNA pseudouridine(38-40) synthase TruA [bacterium]MBU4111305.1 tRNA pseudouridine(38-40) synthase TruA [bacterium]
MRLALTLAYNGTSYLGSQTQTETANTVMGKLESVLAKLGIHTKIVASGRTDKGVHATGQVCHIDVPDFWSDAKKLQEVLNQKLPSSIHVKNIAHVADDFHARYGAKKRVYRYFFKQENANPFENDFITFEKNIDFEEVQEKIKLFIGEHDFANFMKTGSDVGSSVRVVYKAFAYKYKGLIVLNFEANGFLRSQIRLMVGALLKLNAVQIQEQLSCQKKHKFKPAPSNGLYLALIKY